VSWCAELTVIAARRHLAKDILIDITHRIAVGHIQRIHAIHNLCQCAWVLYQENGITHKPTVGR